MGCETHKSFRDRVFKPHESNFRGEVRRVAAGYVLSRLMKIAGRDLHSSRANPKPCRSEPARDSGVSKHDCLTDTPLSRAGSLLQFDCILSARMRSTCGSGLAREWLHAVQRKLTPFRYESSPPPTYASAPSPAVRGRVCRVPGCWNRGRSWPFRSPTRLRHLAEASLVAGQD